MNTRPNFFKPHRKKIIEQDLMKLAEILYYPDLTKGVCQGYSGAWSHYALSKQDNKFYEKLGFLENHKPDFEELGDKILAAKDKIKRKETLTEEESKMIEIPAFFNIMLAYENSEERLQVPYESAWMNPVFDLVKPDHMKNQQLHTYLNKTKIFDCNALTEYLMDLAKILSSFAHPIVINLFNHIHVIAMKFCTTKSCWILVNNDPDTEDYYQEIFSPAELAKNIFDSFKDNHKNGHTLFNTYIIATNFDSELENQFHQFDKKYEIKVEELNQYNEFGVGHLYMACQLGDLKLFNWIIEHPVNLSQTCSMSEATPLASACRHGHYEIVKILLSKLGDKSHSVNSHGITPLVHACRDFEMVKILFDFEPYKNQITIEETNIALTNAAAHNCNDTVNLLLKNGANVDGAQKNEVTPLLFASKAGNFNVVKTLIDHSANINFIFSQTGDTALTFACMFGCHKTIATLLDNGANVNHITNYKISPIMFAANDIELIKLILKYNPDLDWSRLIELNNPTAMKVIFEFIYKKNPNFDFNPIFFEACKENKLSLAKLISEYPLDVNRELNDINPLSIACKNGHEEIVKFLVEEKNADITWENKNGFSSIVVASLSNRANIVKYLMENKLEFLNKKKIIFAFFCACEKNNIETAEEFLKYKNRFISQKWLDKILKYICTADYYVKLANIIVDAGANINLKNEFGQTSLIIACENNLTYMTEFLINKQADLTTMDNNGRFPLLIAAHKNNVENVRKIIAAGANPNQMNEKGITSLLMACDVNNSDMVNTLLVHGATVVMNNQCMSPLYVAYSRENSYVFKLLVDYYPDTHINQDIITGNTVLHLACDLVFYSNSCMDSLLKRGANIQLKNDNGQTPLDICIARKEYLSIKAIIEAAIEQNLSCTDILSEEGMQKSKTLASYNRNYIFLQEYMNINYQKNSFTR